MLFIDEKKLIGKDDLTNEYLFPVFRLVVCFMTALQEDDYEFCESIKSEMERRQRENLIDKEALYKALKFIKRQPTKSSPEQKKCFQDMFEQFL